MDLDKLTKELLDKKAEENNTIDLNAYAMGLTDLKKQLALCNVSKCFGKDDLRHIYEDVDTNFKSFEDWFKEYTLPI